MTAPLKPKQALNFEGALLQELQGDISDSIAQQLLEGLPPLTATSVVHDNGCGPGAVTMAIMGCKPPTDLKIHATDVNPMFLAELQANLTDNPSWPFKVETMDACNLTFPHNTFDYSFINFVFAGLSDDGGAASHILRTLKPGDTGVITGWAGMPWQIALKNAHYKTHGTEEPMAPFLSKSCCQKEEIERATRAAGWKDVKYVQKEAYLNLGTDLRRWASIAWTFLGTPVGGWQQRDERMWEEALDSIVEELPRNEWSKVEGGVNKIRMVAHVAIARE